MAWYPVTLPITPIPVMKIVTFEIALFIGQECECFRKGKKKKGQKYFVAEGVNRNMLTTTLTNQLYRQKECLSVSFPVCTLYIYAN